MKYRGIVKFVALSWARKLIYEKYLWRCNGAKIALITSMGHRPLSSWVGQQSHICYGTLTLLGWILNGIIWLLLQSAQRNIETIVSETDKCSGSRWLTCVLVTVFSVKPLLELCPLLYTLKRFSVMIYLFFIIRNCLVFSRSLPDTG